LLKNIFADLRGNLFGGITAGIVALPLALAFGVQSGLGPDAGLYGAIFIGFFASLFGGTNTQISGPTAPMTAVSMVVIAAIIARHEGDVQQALPYILMVFLLAGLLQVVLGVVGVGRYIKYIPYPVVSGFMTAIGVIILITQLLPMLGYYVADDREYIALFVPEAEERLLEGILREEAGEDILVLEDFRETIERAEEITPGQIDKEARTLATNNSSGVIGAIKTLPRAIGSINFLELGLCLLTILIIYGFKRITTRVPSTLVALTVVSAGAYATGLDYRPIQAIPAGFPFPKAEIFTLFSFGEIAPYIFTALTLAFLGAIDSLLTSVVADNMTRTKHRPNQELIGQGIGNSIAAIFGGLPGAGATIRTVVNINAGGTSKLSGMVAALLLLIILLLMGPIASQIPAAVLAGILITVGIGVMDYKGIKAMPHMPVSEVAVMLVVMILSVVWNLVYAVGIGLVLASLIFMKKIGDATVGRSRVLPLSEADSLEQPWHDELNFPANLRKGVYVKHLDGPLFFGNVNDFQELAKGVPPSTTHLVIRMDKVHYMDQSGLFAMEEAIRRYTKQGAKVLFVDLQTQPRVLIESIEIIPNLVPKEQVFSDFKSLIAFVAASLDKPGG
jgi:SulP family sulfate permease